jgi:hypothetical protein
VLSLYWRTPRWVFGHLSAFDQRGNDTSVSVEILMTAKAPPEQWNPRGRSPSELVGGAGGIDGE